MDWYSRYVLGWKLSVSLENDFCIAVLKQVLEKGSCEIFNTDQGVQFTSPRFTEILLSKNIQISMDGKGRSLDNIFVERLWRSLKYELIYLYEFQTVNEIERAIEDYFQFYNYERVHQSLSYQTPASVYEAKKSKEVVVIFNWRIYILIKLKNGLDNGVHLLKLGIVQLGMVRLQFF